MYTLMKPPRGAPVSHVLAVPFGPTGEVVYNRTYSREKEDGTRETWPETVRRVAAGDPRLVPGSAWYNSDEARDGFRRLQHYMETFPLLPAGRHLWATGVPGRQYLFNCHVAGWGAELSDHFQFSFLRLMEGGGVGAIYSRKHIKKFGITRRSVSCEIIANPRHKDYEELRPSLSTE